MKETKEHFIERINRYNRLHGLIPKEMEKEMVGRLQPTVATPKES